MNLILWEHHINCAARWSEATLTFRDDSVGKYLDTCKRNFPHSPCGPTLLVQITFSFFFSSTGWCRHHQKPRNRWFRLLLLIHPLLTFLRAQFIPQYVFEILLLQTFFRHIRCFRIVFHHSGCFFISVRPTSIRIFHKRYSLCISALDFPILKIQRENFMGNLGINLKTQKQRKYWYLRYRYLCGYLPTVVHNKFKSCTKYGNKLKIKENMVRKFIKINNLQKYWIGCSVS